MWDEEPIRLNSNKLSIFIGQSFRDKNGLFILMVFLRKRKKQRNLRLHLVPPDKLRQSYFFCWFPKAFPAGIPGSVQPEFHLLLPWKCFDLLRKNGQCDVLSLPKCGEYAPLGCRDNEYQQSHSENLVTC
jgi:hypothetical protein